MALCQAVHTLDFIEPVYLFCQKFLVDQLFGFFRTCNGSLYNLATLSKK